MNANLVSDQQYDAWSVELQKLQEEYPDIAKECIYAKEFMEFTDTTSGYNLPYSNPEVVAVATRLLRKTNY